MEKLTFSARRSPVYSTGGCVASSQPLASHAGAQILSQGGNAIDACVAMAAALNVTEPTSTGIGGDCFMLVYRNGQVFSMNGSGRSPVDSCLDVVKIDAVRMGEEERIDIDSIHSITSPGAVRGWLDALKHFGTLTPAQVLAPAISLARNGFPVSPISQQMWEEAAPRLKKQAKGEEWKEWMIHENDEWKVPEVGQIFKVPSLANSFEQLSLPNSTHPDSSFMKPIMETLKNHGSLFKSLDFDHESTLGGGISFKYHDWIVHQHGPNGQGITILLTLGIIQHLEKTGHFKMSEIEPYSTSWFHILIECCKIAFADTEYYITDPEFMDSSTCTRLLSEEHVSRRAKLFDFNRAQHWSFHGAGSTDTVYLCAVDENGTACSFINSLYKPFGSAIICPKTGIVLQNRGCNFSLNPEHPNCYSGGKRPFHTILPGLITDCEGLVGTIGCMGGFQQPQGNVQLIASLYHHPTPHSPQSDIDAGRFMIPFDEEGENVVFLEDSVPLETVRGLELLGHDVRVLSGWHRERFGRAQVILKKGQVLVAGSDGRGDGCALPILNRHNV
jgi:gamma-glutamyltranspeptidase/glutathione hydrolase